MTGKRNPMAQHFLTLTSVSYKCSYKLDINILKQIKDTMLFSRFLTCFWRLKYLGKNYTLLTIEKSQRRIPTNSLSFLKISSLQEKAEKSDY